jgi:hypothetical protein
MDLSSIKEVLMKDLVIGILAFVALFIAYYGIGTFFENL